MGSIRCCVLLFLVLPLLAPAPAFPDVPLACRAHVGGPYAVTYSGAEDDGEPFSFTGALVLDRAGTFELRGHYTYPGGYRFWVDYQGGPWAFTDNLALDAGSGCELLIGPFSDLPTLTGIVSPNGHLIVLQTGAAAGTAVRQAR